LSQVLVIILTILVRLIVVRYLGSELFGGYRYFVAIVAIPSVFYSHIDHSLKRYIPELTNKNKVLLLLTVLLLKLGILLLLLLSLLIGHEIWEGIFFWQNQIHVGSHSMKLIFFILILSIPFQLLNQTLVSYAFSIQKILITQWVNIITLLARFIFIIITFKYSTTKAMGLESLVFLNLFFNIFTSILWLYFHRKWGLFYQLRKYIKSNNYHDIFVISYNKYIRNYALPIQATGIFGFMKQYTPLLFLGKLQEFDALTYYDNIRSIFEQISKIIPNLITIIFSKIVRIKFNNPDVFHIYYRKLNWLHFGFCYGSAIILFSSSSIWLAYYNFMLTKNIYIIVSLFSINLILTSFAHQANYIINLGKSTRILFITSLFRAILLTIIMLALIPKLAGVGAGLAIVMSSLLVVIILNIHISKSKYFEIRRLFYQASITAVTIIIFYNFNGLVFKI
jgi:O-antigen/teichoic acid export membrane protein